MAVTKLYQAALKSCPFCGNAEQEVWGVLLDGDRWSWDVTYLGCRVSTKGYGTEKEALEAWKRRYEQDEIEQDGYITWKRYRQRFVDELTEHIESR